ncbi:MAG: hypothetical protein ACXU9U_04920, partial [Parachlamydiaceae bacterium]
MEMLFSKNYSFNDDPFEPTSDKPIDEDKLTPKELDVYLEQTYGKEQNADRHQETIENIIGPSRAQYLIDLNKSEYFKVLAHFTILSKIKRGWFNLLVTSHTRTTKPSLSDNPSRFAFNDSKKLNDAIIRCFYSRLIQGMSEQEKERYHILLPDKSLPNEFSLTCFDQLLAVLDNAIEDFFCLAQQKVDGYTEKRSLPDLGLDEAINKTRLIIHYLLSQNVNEGYRTDSLRATLIKFASINRAINDRDAALNIIHNEVIDSLPDDIQHLKQIKSESEILPAIKNIFNNQKTKRKKPKLPDDHLIKCSKLVCQMYINTSAPPAKTAEVLKKFSDHHMKPYSIAVSA